MRGPSRATGSEAARPTPRDPDEQGPRGRDVPPAGRPARRGRV